MDGKRVQDHGEMMNSMMKLSMLFVSICICIFFYAPGIEAGGRTQPTKQLMAERPGSDIRVVMYMTPW